MRTQSGPPAVQYAQLPSATVYNEVPAVQRERSMCLMVQPLSMAHACPQGGRPLLCSVHSLAVQRALFGCAASHHGACMPTMSQGVLDLSTVARSR